MRMVRSFLIFLVTGLAIGLLGVWASSIVAFQPPRAIFTSPVPYPPDSTAEGVVVLSVLVDTEGHPTSTDIWRAVPSLTNLAVTSVSSWLFQPALRGATPQTSETTVAFVFRPPVSITTKPTFSPVTARRNSVAKDLAYVPPGIVSVVYPDYPPNTVVSDTVVLRVGVDKSGNAAIIAVIRGNSALTNSAVEAAKKWKFQPATFNGRPIVSVIPIAFVFRIPN